MQIMQGITTNVISEPLSCYWNYHKN